MKTIPGDIAYSDSDALLYQAVDNFLQGKNPYAEANVVTAIRSLKSPTDKITPLRAGPLADVFPYPDQAQYVEIWQDALQFADPVLSRHRIHAGHTLPAFL